MQEKLANLLAIQQSLYQVASLRELAFYITHQSSAIFSYRHAIVWSGYQDKALNIESIQGVVEIDKSSEYYQFICQLIKEAVKFNKRYQQQAYNFSKQDFSTEAQQDWPETLASEVLLVPFIKQDVVVGGALFFANEPIRQDGARLKFLIDSYAYSWHFLQKLKPLSFIKLHKGFFSRRALISILTILIALSFCQVSETVMVPITIVAKNPRLINSPINGVIEHIAVKSEQSVKAKQLLFSLEDKELRQEYQLSLQQLAVSKAKLNKILHGGFNNIQHRSELNILKAEVKERQSQVSYAQQQLIRSKVYAPVSGTVVIDNPGSWLGKPVKIGQKIMEIADKKQIEAEAMLPVENDIDFKQRDRVDIYLTSRPLDKLSGTINHSDFDATLTQQGVLAYRIVINVDNDGKDIPRIGSQGTAKIKGKRVSLIYYVFRRPLTYLRQQLAW